MSSDSMPSPKPEKTFREIISSDSIYAAVEKLGFPAPTPVQADVIPVAETGQDVIVQAKTGSGKTLAYVVPLLQRLEAGSEPTITAGLVVVPTRELAQQVSEVIFAISGIRAPCIIGGVKISEQLDAIERDRRIIVGTPGRVLDLLNQRKILLRTCRYFVLDEADEMLSMDFLEDIQDILSRLPPRRQGLFVSATITPRVESLASAFLKDPVRVSIETPLEAMPNIEHRFYEVGEGTAAKATALCDVLDVVKPRSAIIFCNRRSDTELVEVYLRRRGFDARRMNSDLTQAQREMVMGRIREGELRFLVSTDIAARGIDIEELDCVINYTLPDQPEAYVHRTGRTGRAGRSGLAVSLVGPGDFTSEQNLRKSELIKITMQPLPSDQELSAARAKHFGELLSQANVNVQERDTVVSAELLRQIGVEAPSEALSAFVGRLYRFSLEHMFTLDTRSLEDECDDARGLPRESERREQDDGYGDGRRDNRRSSHRGGGGGGRRR